MELMTSKSGADSQLVESIKAGIKKLKMDQQSGSGRPKDEPALNESNKRQKL